LVKENKMFRVKKFKLKINLKMLREELEEHKTPHKSCYPATIPLATGEPLKNSQKKDEPRQKREAVVQDACVILID
jgi:hypothetical protein